AAGSACTRGQSPGRAAGGAARWSTRWAGCTTASGERWVSPSPTRVAISARAASRGGGRRRVTASGSSPSPASGLPGRAEDVHLVLDDLLHRVDDGSHELDQGDLVRPRAE